MAERPTGMAEAYAKLYELNPDPYEYAAQVRDSADDDWQFDIWDEPWTTREAAKALLLKWIRASRFINDGMYNPDHFRLVRRRKPGPVEEVK